MKSNDPEPNSSVTFPELLIAPSMQPLVGVYGEKHFHSLIENVSDVVAVMNEGLIEQMDTPHRIYRAPATRFVADFIGSANVLAGERSQTDPGLFVTEAGIKVPVLPDGPMAAIAVRPEDIRMLPPNSASGAMGNGVLRHRAKIKRSRFLGGHIEYTVAVDSGGDLTVRADSHRLFAEGETVDLVVDPDRLFALPR